MTTSPSTVPPHIRAHALRMLDDAWTTYASRVFALRPASGRPVALCGVSVDGLGMFVIGQAIRELQVATAARREDRVLLNTVTRQWPPLPAVTVEEGVA